LESLNLGGAVKGTHLQPVQVRSEKLSVHLRSYPGGGKGDQTIEAPEKGSVLTDRNHAGRNASEARAGLERR